MLMRININKIVSELFAELDFRSGLRIDISNPRLNPNLFQTWACLTPEAQVRKQGGYDRRINQYLSLFFKPRRLSTSTDATPLALFPQLFRM